MKFRMDVQHYHQDKLLEPGTVVGDDCDFPWRDDKGHPLPPSMGMTPLDEEARQMMKQEHGSDAPDRDPTKPIPLQGTGDRVKVAAPGTPRPSVSPQTQHRKAVAAANPPPVQSVKPPTNEAFKAPEKPTEPKK